MWCSGVPPSQTPALGYQSNRGDTALGSNMTVFLLELNVLKWRGNPAPACDFGVPTLNPGYFLGTAFFFFNWTLGMCTLFFSVHPLWNCNNSLSWQVRLFKNVFIRKVGNPQKQVIMGILEMRQMEEAGIPFSSLWVPRAPAVLVASTSLCLCTPWPSTCCSMAFGRGKFPKIVVGE